MKQPLEKIRLEKNCLRGASKKEVGKRGKTQRPGHTNYIRVIRSRSGCGAKESKMLKEGKN